MEGTIYLNKSQKTLSEQEEGNIESKPEQSFDAVDMGKVDMEPLPEENIKEIPVEEHFIKPMEDVEVVVEVPETEAPNLTEPFRRYVKRFKEAVIEESRYAPNPIYVDEIATKVAKENGFTSVDYRQVANRRKALHM